MPPRRTGNYSVKPISHCARGIRKMAYCGIYHSQISELSFQRHLCTMSHSFWICMVASPDLTANQLKRKTTGSHKYSTVDHRRGESDQSALFKYAYYFYLNNNQYPMLTRIRHVYEAFVNTKRIYMAACMATFYERAQRVSKMFFTRRKNSYLQFKV